MEQCDADEKDKAGARKKIPRKEVKLGKLLGLADADEETKKAFGDKEKADEMQYSVFRMRQLKKELAEKRTEVLQEVLLPVDLGHFSMRSLHPHF